LSATDEIINVSIVRQFQLVLLRSQLLRVFARNASKSRRMSERFLKSLTFIVDPGVADRTGNPFSSFAYLIYGDLGLLVILSWNCRR